MREVIQSIKLIIIEVPAFRVKLKYGVRQNNFDLKVFTQSLGLRSETFDYGKRKKLHFSNSLCRLSPKITTKLSNRFLHY